jgi:hypothetical protein
MQHLERPIAEVDHVSVAHRPGQRRAAHGITRQLEVSRRQRMISRSGSAHPAPRVARVARGG